MRHVLRFIREEEGQDVIEYGLLVVGVGMLILVGSSSFGAQMHVWLDAVAARLPILS